jgi:hypothetical protein
LPNHHRLLAIKERQIAMAYLVIKKRQIASEYLATKERQMASNHLAFSNAGDVMLTSSSKMRGCMLSTVLHLLQTY